MLVLSLAIIPLLAAPLIWTFSDQTERRLLVIDWLIWAAFVGEYAIRLYLAPHKGSFFRRNLIDVGLIALPFLRPLRIMRSGRALRLLRSARSVTFLLRGLRTARRILTRHKLHYALAITIFMVLGCALLMTSVEKGVAGSNIQSFGDAMWWAAGTVTTVGFGDRYPVTTGGRAIGVALMIVGISLFGMLAASLASYFVRDDAARDDDPQLAELNTRLARIEEALSAHTPDDSPAPAGGLSRGNASR